MTTPLARRSLQCPNCGASAAEDAHKCDYCGSVLSLTACPSCFGAIFKGMRYCPNCGAPVSRQTVAQDRKHKCPRCEVILTPVLIARTPIEECGSCGGIWLDRDIFQSILDDKERQEKIRVYPSSGETGDPQSTQPNGRMYVPCPECGELMLRKNFLGCSGVVVDWCKQHGTWFDRRELQQIINFIQEGGFQKARALELAKLQEEQNRLKEMKATQNLEQLQAMSLLSLHSHEDHETMADVLISIFRKLI